MNNKIDDLSFFLDNQRLVAPLGDQEFYTLELQLPLLQMESIRLLSNSRVQEIYAGDEYLGSCSVVKVDDGSGWNQDASDLHLYYTCLKDTLILQSPVLIKVI